MTQDNTRIARRSPVGVHYQWCGRGQTNDSGQGTLASKDEWTKGKLCDSAGHTTASTTRLFFVFVSSFKFDLDFGEGCQGRGWMRERGDGWGQDS